LSLIPPSQEKKVSQMKCLDLLLIKDIIPFVPFLEI
jgi:hypothetical protein